MCLHMLLCFYLCIYIFTYIYVCFSFVHVCINVCVYTYVYTYMHVCKCIWMCFYVYACAHGSISVYSSVNPLNGSCRLFVVPYKAILFRLCGKPNHLCRYQLIFFSIAIIVVIVISYIIIGHNILGKIELHNRDLISVVISVIVLMFQEDAFKRY